MTRTEALAQILASSARKVEVVTGPTCGLCGEAPHTNRRRCPEAGYLTVGNEDRA